MAPVATINNQALRIDQWAQVNVWISYSDADGNPATQFQFWDGGSDATSGYFFTPDNHHHAVSTAITVDASNLANVWVRGGSVTGSETMYVRAYDGTSWSAWDAFTLTTVPNTAPVATINDHSLRYDEWSRVDSWISYSDANGDPATQYQFWDGGTGTTSGYFFTPDNHHHAASTAITVDAADLADLWIRGGGAAGGSETMYVRAFDGSAWSAWDSFTFTTLPNNTPVATVGDHALRTDQWSRVDGWLGYTDADGDQATQYQFWDGGTGATSGYFWTPDNEHHAASTAITVAAADLSNVWVRGGSVTGSETMYVRAYDGTSWGAWDAFALTTVPNSAPVATINDHSLRHDEWSRVDSWISYSDANGDPATQFQFWDGGSDATSGYFFTPDNHHHAVSTAITVDASNLANVWVRGGSVTGSETMYVRAYDGTSWSAWDSFTFTTLPNTAPVATINDHTLHHDEWSRVDSWISYSDANGDPATQYQFWDGGTGTTSGYFFTPDNHHHAASTAITVDAADLADLWIRGGGAAGGSETMYVRAFDGSAWSAWDSFTFTTLPNNTPVATVGDHALQIDQWSRVDGWLGYTDADGDQATQYQFWDGGIGATSGYFFTPDNHHHAASTAITVAAADLANVWVRGGSVTGSETMYVRAYDGTNWGAWDSFTLTTFA